MEPAQWLTVTTDPAPAVVDGRSCRTRAAFFDEVARVLDFPPYFGHNWDALADCLRDVLPLSLTVAHAHELLTEDPPQALKTLLTILKRATPEGLTLTLSTHPSQLSFLHQRIASALP
jgi:RNAse (barnase) inhibitor barstar